jgi:hypothetical protein
MKGNIGKGSEIFAFFGDYYKFLGEYYEPENTDDYWESMMNASEKILGKYAACDLYLLAKGMLLITAIWLSDSKFKGNAKGSWLISFKREGKHE